jgi:hypothetical protein
VESVQGGGGGVSDIKYRKVEYAGSLKMINNWNKITLLLGYITMMASRSPSFLNIFGHLHLKIL